MNTSNGDTPDELVTRGLAASQAGDSAAAIELWQQACAAAPGSGVPHFLMASEFAALGDMERSEAAFANAVLLAPGLLVARYQLGLLQFSSGRAAMALVTWAPLLQVDSDDPIAPALSHFVRGYAALAHEAFEDALASFDAGLEANTTNAPLSGDIRLVVDRIHALLRGQPLDGAQGGGEAAATPAEEGGAAASEAQEAHDASSDSHVLLANYQSQGKPH